MSEESQVSAEDLLQMARAGDMRVGTLLFDRFEALVNRRVWRILGADQEHDDIVQAVFLAIIRGISSVKDARALEGWVLGVTHKTILRELRRRKLRWPWMRQEPEDGNVPGLHGSSPGSKTRGQQQAGQDGVDGRGATRCGPGSPLASSRRGGLPAGELTVAHRGRRPTAQFSGTIPDAP